MHKCIKNKRNGISNRKLLFKTLALIFKTSPCLLMIVFVCEFLIGFLQTGTLIAWQYLVNVAEQFISNRDNYALLILALVLSLCSYIVMDLFRLLLESLYTLLNNRLAEAFQSKLYDKCRVINTIYFEDTELYNKIDRANKSIKGMISLVGIFGVFVMAVSRLSTLGTYVLLAKPALVLVIILPIIPIFITRIIRGKDLYNLNYEQSENRRECNYYRKCIFEKETKTTLAVSYFYQKWGDLYRDINLAEMKVNKKLSFIFSFLNILKYSIYIFAIVISAIYLFDGSIDVGMFALITGMLGTCHATIEIFVLKTGDVAGTLHYAKDYFSFINMSCDIIKEKNRFKCAIKLNEVCFAYPKSKKNVLCNIDLSIKYGEKIAFVGINGAGKTTLAKIILGLYNPSSGQILFDDKIRPDNSLVDGSVVFQNFCKYFLSLRENVAFGNIDDINNDKDLLEKLNEFELDLSKMEDSLDTQLGREFEGIELSGGEWQKIALARGFFRKSDFVVLDEPNSGLDPLMESKLFHRFLELLKNRTGIIITHRIGIAALADRIILLENGQIIEKGTHLELMNKRGRYCEMFETQATMYK